LRFLISKVSKKNGDVPKSQKPKQIKPFRLKLPKGLEKPKRHMIICKIIKKDSKIGYFSNT
jgi:hypothetical protein